MYVVAELAANIYKSLESKIKQARNAWHAKLHVSIVHECVQDTWIISNLLVNVKHTNTLY